jgi:hypothetical protein
MVVEIKQRLVTRWCALTNVDDESTYFSWILLNVRDTYFAWFACGALSILCRRLFILDLLRYGKQSRNFYLVSITAQSRSLCDLA